ncbi:MULTISPECIES: carboxy terminal-processing peptidase [Marinomonas]|uniref:Carboxy terminal-processing peptidase n=1 Tax=Marinomonas arctica TaxID=383750 RepID=A0A7H1JAC0_9GAMM|nr:MULTISPECIES: carboxy terminal-processing peptidase [Marinomonas]MCS7486123.1 peptidase S41 [Marinomonas sp. BSi20414]QNT07436.1 carboxy terminal-processing peptidase [Marinomonas arctica]GGN26725.1 peptidase S41 [Marinomonas arctica]
MNYKRLLLCLLIGYTFTSTSASAYQELQPPHEYDKVSKELVEMIEGIHYNRPHIDDAISAKAFDYYIDALDPSKSFFLQSDIDELSQYRGSFDDALRNGNTQVAFTIYNLYLKRLETRLDHIQKHLPDMVKSFDYDVDETLNVDPDAQKWATTQAELDDYWRKRLKNRALTLKLNGESEEKIISTIERRYKNQLKQVDQTNATDVFQIFANSITAALDPHSNYFAPRASETFNISMSLSLEGIGAVLQMDDDYTKVVRLVPGGPAATQSDLAPNDRIIAVGQEGKPMIDVVGMRLDDVVDMIRGERDTTVILEVTPSKGDTQTSKRISIVRKKVKLEDQSAKKEVVEIERDGEKYKVGVITLPTFYSDFAAIQAGDKNYKSSTRDTKQLIDELREEGISALILDLRNNGGGSLQEANALTGLFIPSGPTVQIRDQSGRVTPLGDTDTAIAYSGPMAVLVNRMSASASEIVAGALQDYGRALILGDQTFGKGTVQVLQELDKGQLKITQAKFYRVSGESTQHKGVMPDIAFPSLIDKETIGESALDNPLPWDKIHETRYPVYWNIPAYLPILEPRHEARMAKDPNFVAINDQISEFKSLAESYKTVSLQESTRIQQREEGKKRELERENTRRKALGLERLTSVEDIVPIEEDTYAKEASEILLDFIATNQVAQQQADKQTAQK